MKVLWVENFHRVRSGWWEGNLRRDSMQRMHYGYINSTKRKEALRRVNQCLSNTETWNWKPLVSRVWNPLLISSTPLPKVHIHRLHRWSPTSSALMQSLTLKSSNSQGLSWLKYISIICRFLSPQWQVLHTSENGSGFFNLCTSPQHFVMHQENQ